jgi:hypothetical protein
MEKPSIPKSFQPPLWYYWVLIKAMRKRPRMWKETARVLEAEHGRKASHKTIQNFYERVPNPDKKVPYVFTDPIKLKKNPPDPAGGAAPKVAAPAEQPPDPQAAVEAARARAKARTQSQEKPKWDFGYDPNKPLKDQQANE